MILAWEGRGGRRGRKKGKGEGGRWEGGRWEGKVGKWESIGTKRKNEKI